MLSTLLGERPVCPGFAILGRRTTATPDQAFLISEIGQGFGKFFVKELGQTVENFEPERGGMLDQIQQIGPEESEHVRPCR